MDINWIILKEIKPYLHQVRELSRYNISEDTITPFLLQRGDFSARQYEAIRIIEEIMNVHGKKDLIRTVIELAKVEQRIRELAPWARDHVVHALLSFILGIYVNERILRPLSATPVDDFQWKLAGLFHDVGYPMEMAVDALAEPFVETINKSKRAILKGKNINAPDLSFKLIPPTFDKLQNDVNGFDLIQERINKWDLRIDARRAYDRMIDSGKACHGMISSLAVLYLIDLLYQKFNEKREYKDVFMRRRPQAGDINFNQKYFETDVVSACSAIFIHNLPKKWFANARIHRSNAPVAFLLKLSDSLQIWERPSKENPTGFSATKFNIAIENNQLIFCADIDIPEKEKRDLEDNMSTLIAPDIQTIYQD